jgi:pyruvate dehydrogenase E2 component (dihydrolipoamide acetyltransferase)/2-oxoisovalerate dehydrogenase E2 component (dihydrolipoyl transacylase)
VQNIGIAMASEHGLVVPVLKGVESMGLHDIIRGYAALREKATAGKLQSSDMKGATISLSNFGAVEGEVMWATPMINEPETAIVALARMRKAPVAVADEVVVKDILPVSWSFDHRIIDGELGVHVSHYFATLLKDPAGLL